MALAPHAAAHADQGGGADAELLGPQQRRHDDVTPGPHAAVGALTVDDGDHVWDLARLGWALHGKTTAVTVPIGEFTSGDSGSVVVWDHDAAGQLFEALAADAQVPQAALDAQP